MSIMIATMIREAEKEAEPNKTTIKGSLQKKTAYFMTSGKLGF